MGDLHFNIRNEFNFQWQNINIQDIFEGEGAERAFEVLTRSGELENITPSTSPEIPNSLFGYSNREPEEILTNIASQHRDIINRSTPFSSLQRKQIAVLARIYLATSTISEKRGSLQQ